AERSGARGGGLPRTLRRLEREAHRDGGGITSNEDRNIKIVRFKDLVSDTDSNMAVDSPQAPVASWKYKLLGRGSSVSICEEELEFLEGDIMRTTANGVPAINFSERIQQILIRDMATTVVVKLLERLFSCQISEHGRLLNGSHSKPLDYLWTISHSLAMDSRLKSPSTFPNTVMAWVRLPGLSGEQHAEYESLPTICYSCGRYGHVRDLCPYNEATTDGDLVKDATKTDLPRKEKPVELLKPFGPWVLIKRKSRRNPRTNRSLNAKISAKEGVGSRFSALMSLGEDTTVIDAVAMGLS
ncbi:hypothetical protein Gohar_000716, partial [Gossypium harknessii]|nr:hypothetical protein [Gossypium harknessii]